MGTSKVLQKPQILEIIGSTIRIKHPDIFGYKATSMTAPLTAAGTSLTVRDNNGLTDDDWFILGTVGNAKTEECDVNGTVTRGTALTITNTTKFSHEIDTSITKILERGIKIYGASTDGGSGTLIASVDAITTPIADAISIQWDKEYTEYTLISTDTAYSFYYVVFTDGTTSSSASDYIASSGVPYNTGKAIAESALKLVRAEVDGSLITWEWLLEKVNDFQDATTNYVLPDGTMKDWPFEIVEDVTSITTTLNQNSYAVSSLSTNLKYPDSFQGIIQVKVGSEIMEYMDLDAYEDEYNGIAKTTVSTAASAGNTTLVLTDSYEFGESGTAYVGIDTITYTGNTESTGTLTGIPASGIGSITTTQAVGTVVWQGVKPATPSKYTLLNGNILLDIPIDSDTAGKKIKVKYYGVVPRVDSLSDTLPMPFTYIAKYYIGAEIEYRKKNMENGDRLTARFVSELQKQAQKQLTHMPEMQDYYTYIE